MDDIVIFKAADHMNDGIHLADVCQELIAEALALGGTLNQAGNVYEFNDGGGYLSGGLHV